MARLFLLPALAVILLVTVYPLGYALFTSLHNTTFLRLTSFAGLQNYAEVLLNPTGQNAILRSALFLSGSLVLVIPLGMMLALLLNQPFRGRGIFRVLIIVPWVVSELITALLWKWTTMPNAGPVSVLLQQVTGTAPDLLGPPTAMLTLILANVWRTYALPTVLFLAALQGIPADIIEQSQIDGASAGRRFFSIVLPLMRSTVLVAITMLSIYYMNVVTLPLILTGGGPLQLTEVLPLNLYKEAFEYFRLGRSSTIAIVLVLFNFLLSVLYFRVLKPFEEES
ncbi:MAG: carbohydrate ABC transporter permease [Chloroflexota bacterium]